MMQPAARRGRSPRPRAALYSRIKADARVLDIEVEQTDGWFVTLNPGWRWPHDPSPVHCFGAGTLTDAMKDIRAAEPCDCDQCKRELQS